MCSIIYGGQTDGFICLLAMERSTVFASAGKAGVWRGGALAVIPFCHRSLGCCLLHRVIKLLSAPSLGWADRPFLQKSPV